MALISTAIGVAMALFDIFTTMSRFPFCAEGFAGSSL
jgi:hypothetical protein